MIDIQTMILIVSVVLNAVFVLGFVLIIKPINTRVTELEDVVKNLNNTMIELTGKILKRSEFNELVDAKIDSHQLKCINDKITKVA